MWAEANLTAQQLTQAQQATAQTHLLILLRLSTEGGVTGDYRELSLFAGSIPENTPTGGALAAMADYIQQENSNGTLNAIAYYDTALGDATSMVQGLQQGTVDIGVSGTAYFSGLNSEIEVFQLPFLFEDLETARKCNFRRSS